jgi:hypothetical protein
VLSELKEFGSAMHDIDTSISLKMDSATLEIDAPGAAKLIGTQRDIEAWTRKYIDAIGETNAQELLGAVKNYVTRTQARNNEILQYNTYIAVWKQSNATIASSTKVVETQQHGLAKMDTMIPAYAVAIDQAFFDITAVMLRLLYEMDRATKFVRPLLLVQEVFRPDFGFVVHTRH